MKYHFKYRSDKMVMLFKVLIIISLIIPLLFLLTLKHLDHDLSSLVVWIALHSTWITLPLIIIFSIASAFFKSTPGFFKADDEKVIFKTLLTKKRVIMFSDIQSIEIFKGHFKTHECRLFTLNNWYQVIKFELNDGTKIYYKAYVRKNEISSHIAPWEFKNSKFALLKNYIDEHIYINI